MYCGSCREERLGTAKFCVACGSKLDERALAEVEAELAHVQYLLAEIPRWDVKQAVKDHLDERYQRRERLLLATLQEKRPHASAETALAATPELVAVPPPEAAPVEAPAPVESAAPAEAPLAPVIQIRPEEAPAPESQPAEPAAAVAREAAEARPSEKPESELAPLPELPGGALFDVPRAPSAAEQVLEEASTWSRVWKPFLYESIGWFVGGFLILAGTFYFVAESWAGMTSLTRSLVIFGVTAGYAAGFRLWGGYFSRKESLAGAGRILELIGAAVAPLTAIALQPMAAEHPVLLWPLAALAAWGAALLARVPATKFGAPSVRTVQALTFLATLMLGVAPLLGRGGASMLWLDAAPVLLLWRALDLRAPDERRAPAFAFLAPAYLVLLFALALHVALAAAGAAPAVGTYAPFLAAVGGFALRARTLEEERSADALAVGVFAAQGACLVLSATGAPPAFFVTSAVVAFTAWTLSLGGAHRTRWLYGAYVAGYLAFQSAGQLVPGALREFFEHVQARLGYGGGQRLPFAFAAVYAVPFVLGGAALAARRLARAKQEIHPERSEAVAEVLLRATAGASAAFIALAVSTPDPRPGLWTVPLLAGACTGLGMWLDRRYLGWVGALGAMLLPVFTRTAFGLPAASVLCGLVALAYAALSAFYPREEPHGRAVSALALTLGALALAVSPPFHLSGALALVLASAAAALIAWRHEDDNALRWSAALGAFAVPLALLVLKPDFAPLGLAVSGLGVALLASRREALAGARPVAMLANVAAACWQAVVIAHKVDFGLELSPLLGVTLLLGVAAAAACAWRDGRYGVLGALFLAPALMAPVGFFVPWPDLSPAVSLGLYVALAVGASAWAALRGRSLAVAFHAGAGLFCAAVLLTSLAFSHWGGWLFCLGALAAVASSRALSPRFSIPWAALLALPWFSRHDALLGLGALLTGLALLDLLPRVRELLLGERTIGRVASICAILIALGAALAGERFGGEYGVVAACLLLPLAWTRVGRHPIFITAGPLLLLVFAHHSWADTGALVALPVFAVGVTRLVWHVPVARRLLLGVGADGKASHLHRYLLVASGLCGFALWWNGGRMDAPLLWATAASFLLGAGAPMSLRIVSAAVLVLPSRQAMPPLMAALLAIGIVQHHAPARLAKLLGTDDAPRTRPTAALTMLALAFIYLGWLSEPLQGLWVPAAALFACAFLLSQRWLMAPVPVLIGLALADRFPPAGGVALAGAAFAAAAFAAASRRESVARALGGVRRVLGPGFEQGWGDPWWLGGVLGAAALLATQLGLLDLLPRPYFGAPALLPMTNLLLVLAVLALLLAPRSGQVAAAAVLLDVALWLVAPRPWAPVVVALGGVALCLAGHVLRERHPVARAAHHAGWVMALTALLGLQSLVHPATPVTVALGVACAWICAWRRGDREPVAWAATFILAHVLVFHLGAVFSTGKPPGYVFPYISLVSAVGAAVVLLLPARADRRWVGLAFAAMALAESVGGLATIEAQATREAVVGLLALLGVFAVLARTALRRNDELPAHLAQVALALGYLVVRLHGMGARTLGSGDSLAALVAGAVFSGLYVWTRRQGESLKVFVRPALTGAFLLPLVGLLAAPWREPLVAAALLVGHAAHFCALATQASTRRAASVLAAVAFNGALVLAWMGTGAGEPQYYVIPAGLSLLGLVRMFRDDLTEEWEARLRAVAITAIYAASAWRPLMFEAGWGLVACVFVCVVGVAVGVAARIRSYVYLGTAFMVTSVVANLVRYGARDHRLGALFLSGLGLLVIGGMVLITSKRAELMQRYERVKEMLEDWQG